MEKIKNVEMRQFQHEKAAQIKKRNQKRFSLRQDMVNQDDQFAEK